MQELADGLIWYVVFLFSVTLHEAGHAWAALRGGDPTAYLGGQVSINPEPHIRREPFGMVILPLLSVLLWGWPFGFASAPYNPHWAARYPRRAAWMSLAGPGANLLLVVAAGIIVHMGIAAGLFYQPPSVNHLAIVGATGDGLAGGVGMVVSALFSLNLILLVLNLIPLPPLDGSGALTLVIGDRLAERFRELASQPMVGLIGLLIAWRIFGSIFHPIWLAAINLLYPGSHYA